MTARIREFISALLSMQLYHHLCKHREIQYFKNRVDIEQEVYIYAVLTHVFPSKFHVTRTCIHNSQHDRKLFNLKTSSPPKGHHPGSLQPGLTAWAAVLQTGFPAAWEAKRNSTCSLPTCGVQLKQRKDAFLVCFSTVHKKGKEREGMSVSLPPHLDPGIPSPPPPSQSIQDRPSRITAW
jgi:hypothetical protein